MGIKMYCPHCGKNIEIIEQKKTVEKKKENSFLSLLGSMYKNMVSNTSPEQKKKEAEFYK